MTYSDSCPRNCDDPNNVYYCDNYIEMTYMDSCAPKGPSWRDSRNVLGLLLDLARLRYPQLRWINELEEMVWSGRQGRQTVRRLRELEKSPVSWDDLPYVAVRIALRIALSGPYSCCSCASDFGVSRARCFRVPEYAVQLAEARWRYLDMCGEVSADLRAAFEACWAAGEPEAAQRLIA